MIKYSFEFKKKIVRAYLQGEGGYHFLSNTYEIDHSLIRRWVANYKQFGEEGLMRSRQKQVYPFEFKLHVVELYLTSELSYSSLALQAGMTNPSQIARWVMDYRAAGPEALRPKGKMDKKKIIEEVKTIVVL